MRTRSLSMLVFVTVSLFACTTTPSTADTGGTPSDAATLDTNVVDAASVDAAAIDASTVDASTVDASTVDASTVDTNPTVLDLTLADYTITPSQATIPAGTVVVHATNSGTHQHEAVFALTTLAADMLPTLSDGTVDESMLTSPGEISETPAGGTMTVTLELTAGHYVIFCNVLDHYSRGMYTTLTVTP